MKVLHLIHTTTILEIKPIEKNISKISICQNIHSKQDVIHIYTCAPVQRTELRHALGNTLYCQFYHIHVEYMDGILKYRNKT